MVYGTPFEKLEDEERNAISKRPKGVQEEIVTDERGKRRFHGAFTGGFSAGYFNTAGSKHGWVPQTFKSSREDRADKVEQATMDFMDDEDLGEFGIAARKLRPKMDFIDSLMATPGEKCLLAWERSSTTLSSSQSVAVADSGSLVEKLSEMLRPVSDSIGVRLLKKMGWRPGKGIGMKMSRRQLELQKMIDAREAGRLGQFDEEAVREIEEKLQSHSSVEFSPDDVSMVELTAKENVHGLGYQPLKERAVLSQKYGVVEAALKVTKKSKGIRGQAFGVGAFEEEDDDIYTNFDLSQYDFEVGASTSTAQNEVSKFDSSFVPSSSTKRNFAHQKFFVAPQLPHGWRPMPRRTQKKEQREKEKRQLPETVAKACERLTPFQRAKILGDSDHSVMEMLSSEDRERLKSQRGKETEKKRDRKIGGRERETEPFEEEPMKAHRFKQYVNYLKRGIAFPQPVDMTRLEWERELDQFQEALTPELRSLLPEVRERQKPLAKIDFAAPIAEHLKQRFEKESEGATDFKPSTVKDERVEAVRLKQFGQATRQKHAWHPARDLCKRFNVPNPYPDSQMVGAPGLSRRAQKDYSSQYSLMDLGGLRDTAAELASEKRRHISRFDQQKGTPEDKAKQLAKTNGQREDKLATDKKEEVEENGEELVPFEFLAALFGEEDEEVAEEEEVKEEEQSLFKLPTRKRTDRHNTDLTNGGEKMVRRTDVITINDVVEDEDVYGPAMPPEEFLLTKITNGTAGKDGEETRLVMSKRRTEEIVITVKSEEEEEEEKDKRKRKKKREKKRKEKRERKEKKEKERERKKRKRRRSTSESSSSSN